MGRGRSIRAGLVALLVAAAVSGCGDSKSDEDKVRDATAEWYDALADRDGERVCDLLESNWREDLKEGSDCASDFAPPVMDLEGKGPSAPTIENVDVDGEKAAVTVEGDDTPPKLVKEGSDWKIVFEPSSYVPDVTPDPNSEPYP